LNKPETTPPTYFHHIRDGTLFPLVLMKRELLRLQDFDRSLVHDMPENGGFQVQEGEQPTAPGHPLKGGIVDYVEQCL